MMDPSDPRLTTPIPGIDPAVLIPSEACNQFHSHAVESYPNECIGYVKNGSYHRLENISTTPRDNASVPPEVMAQLLIDEIDVLCHSHPDGPHCPSAADIALQMETDIPHAIVSCNSEAATGPIVYGGMVQRQPLLGRTFIHGFQDCFGLGLDFYRTVMGTDLCDFPRDWSWWDKHNEGDGGLYLDHFREWGFVSVEDDLQFGDVFLLRAASKVPNHCGIYLGNHLMLHHLAGREAYDPSRLSTVEPLVRWRQHGRIEGLLRHGG